MQDYADSTRVATRLTGGSNQPAGAAAVEVGIGVNPAADFAAGSGGLNVFAVEPATQRLWILRQSGSSDTGSPWFGPWVQLGNPVDTIAAPALMQGHAAVFMVDLEQTVFRFAQNASDFTWGTTRLAAPTPRRRTSPPPPSR